MEEQRRGRIVEPWEEDASVVRDSIKDRGASGEEHHRREEIDMKTDKRKA